MKAIVLSSFGSADNFTAADLPIPDVRTGELRIKVKTVSFNPVDYQIRKGQPESRYVRSMILGRHLSGSVDAVYAVGDFGYSTVVGDPRMDVAGAIAFLEVVEGYQAADTQLLLRHGALRPDKVSTDIIELYRLYDSLYFSHCRHDDAKTYAWCINNLRANADRLAY